MFLALFGLGKKSSSPSRKISPKEEKTSSSKSARKRKSSKAVIDFSADSISSSSQHTEHDGRDILSVEKLNDSIGSGEYDAVPDAVDYQIPFATSDAYEVKSLSSNKSRTISQGICQTQKLKNELGEEIRQVREEFDEKFQQIQNEMKKHRKWY